MNTVVGILPIRAVSEVWRTFTIRHLEVLYNTTCLYRIAGIYQQKIKAVAICTSVPFIPDLINPSLVIRTTQLCAHQVCLCLNPPSSTRTNLSVNRLLTQSEHQRMVGILSSIAPKDTGFDGISSQTSIQEILANQEAYAKIYLLYQMWSQLRNRIYIYICKEVSTKQST